MYPLKQRLTKVRQTNDSYSSELEGSELYQLDKPALTPTK